MDFVPIKVAWNTSTFIFYLVVILLCYFITAVGRKTVLVSGVSTKYRKELWLVLIPAVLIFIKGFGTTGRDIRRGYYFNFLSAISMEEFRDQSVEIGYRVLNVVVRAFTDKYWVFILICSLITILPVIHMLKKYASQIDLPAAVLLYVTCYFFQGFSLMRIYMASSLSLYAFDKIIERKPSKALIWIILGASLHTSALIMIIPYFLCLAKMLSRKMIGISLAVGFFIAWIGRDSIVSLLFSVNGRYSHYVAADTVKIGFEQITYYAPLFLLLVLGKRTDNHPQFARVGFIYLVMSCFLGMMSYVISVIGRMAALTLPLVIVVPYYFQRVKESHPHYRRMFNLLMCIYCIARFVIYIIGYYNLDDIMPYSNAFGWVI